MGKSSRTHYSWIVSQWWTSPAADVDRRGGHVALDFVNTVAWRGDRERRTDCLNDYRDLLAWSWAAELLTRREGDALAATAAADPTAARRVVGRARRLREALHSLWADAAPDSSEPLKTVADEHTRALRTREMRLNGDRVDFVELGAGLAAPVGRIAIPAVGLLTSHQLSEVKGCHSAECGWLFLDRSHRQNRKWCSAEDCGNRVRVRRHYERARRTAPDATEPRQMAR
jgi:predicted RNA-binding Zn ribbon-like protein